jgi:hypothetical protein
MVFKSSSYSREIEQGNRFIKPSGSQRRLQTQSTYLPANDSKISISTGGRSICFKIKQTDKRVCFGNSRKRKGLFRECDEDELVKIEESVSPSTNSDDQQSAGEVRKRRKESDNGSTEMARSDMESNFGQDYSKKDKPRKRRRYTYKRKTDEEKRTTASSGNVGSKIIEQYIEERRRTDPKGVPDKGTVAYDKLIFEKEVELLEEERRNWGWKWLLSILNKKYTVRELRNLFPLSESTWNNYKRSWNKFAEFLRDEKVSPVDWDNKTEVTNSYFEFLNWLMYEENEESGLINMRKAEFHIFRAGVVFFIRTLHPDLEPNKMLVIRRTIRTFNMKYPLGPRYSTMWDSDILINYYGSEKNWLDQLSEENPEKAFRFLQKRAAVFLGFFMIMRIKEAWSISVVRDIKDIPGEGYEIQMITKNNNKQIQKVLIPDIQLRELAKGMEFVEKNSDIDYRLLNPYKAIRELRVCTEEKFGHPYWLFVNPKRGSHISYGEYRKLLEEAFVDMHIPEGFSAYSLKHAAISKLVRLKVQNSYINQAARFSNNSNVATTHYAPRQTEILTRKSLMIREGTIKDTFNIYLGNPEDTQITQEEEQEVEIFLNSRLVMLSDSDIIQPSSIRDDLLVCPELENALVPALPK